MQGKGAREEIAARCRAKYPRGLNLMIVSQEELDNGTFTPTSFIGDRGRIFLNYERLCKDAFTDGLPEPINSECKNVIETYDPFTTIIWLFVLQDSGEFQLFTTNV